VAEGMASITAVGLPPREATRLRKNGVRTTDGLLRVAASKPPPPLGTFS